MRYKAFRQPDGTWTIKDVPIFAEHKRRLSKDREINVDAKWMERAVKRALSRKENDNYLPPLNKNHHETPDEVSFMGHFIPTRVGKMSYDGKEINAMFADLIGINDEDMAEIMAGKLPYRSVEIENVNDPDIACLSLLDHNPPYFKFPNLQVEQKKEPALSYKTDKKRPAFYSALFNFKEQPMGGNKTAKGKTAVNYEEEVIDDTEEKEGEKAQAEVIQEGGDKMDVVITLLKQLIAMQKPATATEEGTEDENAEVAPDQMQAAIDAKYQTELSQLRGELTGLKKRIDTDSKTAKYNSAIDTASQALKPYHITRDEVVKYAKEHGVDSLAGFVTGVKRSGPGKVQTKKLNYSAPVQKSEPEFMKNYSGNPVALAVAREACDQYKRQSNAVRSSHTLEDYVKYQVMGAAFNESTKKSAQAAVSANPRGTVADDFDDDDMDDEEIEHEEELEESEA